MATQDKWNGAERREEGELSKAEIVRIAGDIVAAHVSNNPVPVNDVPQLIANVHGALAGLVEVHPEPEAELVPMVSARSSVKPDAITCMDCGKKQKTLKRHLMTNHHMTPDEYREKWGLSADYPMVAPNYSEQRRKMALDLGLGKRMQEAATKRRTAKRAANG